MHDFAIRAGDRFPSIQATLSQEQTAVDLTGATVALRWRPREGVTVVEKAASVVDAAAGVVKYDWAAGDTDTPGEYLAVFRVTFPNGKRATFPNRAYLTLVMTADL